MSRGANNLYIEALLTNSHYKLNILHYIIDLEKEPPRIKLLRKIATVTKFF